MNKLIALLLHRIAELENLALRDSLTNCLNRHALTQKIGQTQLIAVIAVDIPNLGGVNLHEGYEAGDALIGKVACLLKKTIRNQDIVYRVGGDEFLIVISDCSFPGANKIKRRIEALNMGLYLGVDVGTDLKTVIEGANKNRDDQKRKLSKKYAQLQITEI